MYNYQVMWCVVIITYDVWLPDYISNITILDNIMANCGYERICRSSGTRAVNNDIVTANVQLKYQERSDKIFQLDL